MNTLKGLVLSGDCSLVLNFELENCSPESIQTAEVLKLADQRAWTSVLDRKQSAVYLVDLGRPLAAAVDLA